MEDPFYQGREAHEERMESGMDIGFHDEVFPDYRAKDDAERQQWEEHEEEIRKANMANGPDDFDLVEVEADGEGGLSVQRDLRKVDGINRDNLEANGT